MCARKDDGYAHRQIILKNVCAALRLRDEGELALLRNHRAQGRNKYGVKRTKSQAETGCQP